MQAIQATAKGKDGFMTKAENETVFHIEMLGGFKLTVGDKVISDTISRTHQLWNLLEYLIAFRHKTISQEELDRKSVV